VARDNWRLTVRDGPDVQKLSFGTLEQALDAVRETVERVRRQGDLPDINALRDFSPNQRVHARIEVSGPGRLRAPKAGIDVMGNGAVMAYRGTVNKQALGADSLAEALDRLRETLSG
jgi:hypothetical protein